MSVTLSFVVPSYKLLPNVLSCAEALPISTEKQDGSVAREILVSSICKKFLEVFSTVYSTNVKTLLKKPHSELQSYVFCVRIHRVPVAFSSSSTSELYRRVLCASDMTQSAESPMPTYATVKIFSHVTKDWGSPLSWIVKRPEYAPSGVAIVAADDSMAIHAMRIPEPASSVSMRPIIKDVVASIFSRADRAFRPKEIEFAKLGEWVDQYMSHRLCGTDAFLEKMCSPTGGLLSLEDGRIYQGTLLKETWFHGIGILLPKNDGQPYYEGEFSEDKYHGFGLLKKEGFWAYKGSFVQGKFHGAGVYSSMKGSLKYYIGSFENGTMNGFGILMYNDGSTYVGEFADGKHHGNGVSVSSSGTVYRGEYRNNIRCGKGVYVNSLGNKIKGIFKNHQAHGRIKYTSRDGKTEIRNYQYGKWIQKP